MTREQQKELLQIKNEIASQFTKSDWMDFGYTLGFYDLIGNHPRLLRSLSFGDDDYEACVLEVLSKIVNKDNKILDEVKAFMSARFEPPIVSDFISTGHNEPPPRNITFAPSVFTIPTKPQNEKLVSVMLPFILSKSFEAIKNSCDEIGLMCVKADDIWENTTFIQDIFELIFTSRVVVADFTGKNPNVFYEVGIAHTLGKTVIPISQSINDIPSDLRHHRVLIYHPNEQGYKELTIEIKKRLQTLIPTASYDF